MTSKVGREFFARQQANPTHWTHDSALLRRANEAADTAFSAACERLAPMTGPSGDYPPAWDAKKLATARYDADVAFFDLIRAAGWDVRGAGGE